MLARQRLGVGAVVVVAVEAGAGPFERLLQTLDFSPSRDTLFLLAERMRKTSNLDDLSTLKD